MENYLDYYQDKTVLVTGGAGAIGSNLCRRLAELGAQAIILDDLSSGERWNVPSMSGILFVEGDILDEVKLKRVFFERPQMVFHRSAEPFARLRTGPSTGLRTSDKPSG